MLKSVYLFPYGLVAAFDENGQQVSKQQGPFAELHYRSLREQRLVNDLTRFIYTDANGQKQERTGREMEAMWMERTRDYSG